MTPKSIFHSYTLAEAEHATGAWAGIALLSLSAGFFLSSQVARHLIEYSYYPDTDLLWAFGILAGAATVGTFTGLWIELHHLRKAVHLRKAYKKEHPEQFDTAGDPK